MPEPPPPRRAVWSWALYDLANTIFSFNILSFYFPIWAKDHLGAADWHLSVAFGGSMALVALLSPILGAVSDRARRRMPFLAATTLGCVGATAVLGLLSLGTALVVYAVANVLFQLGLVFYDALLPEISTAENVGAVGGAGIGLGYVGSFLGLGVGAVLLASLDRPHPWIFAATAGLFLLFALPCFHFVRERPRRHVAMGLAASLAQLAGTARDVLANGPLARFLLARFIYADAANTLILFMGIYATREAGYTEEAAQLLLGGGIAAAIAGGLAFGKLVDRLGPQPVLQGVLGLWMGTLLLAAAVPLIPLPQAAFWGVALGAGVSLGGTWAADRPLMLRLTPPERVGEFYGVYGMVGRFAAVVGPLAWALVVDGLGWGRPVAVLTLFVGMVVAALVLRTVRS